MNSRAISRGVLLAAVIFSLATLAQWIFPLKRQDKMKTVTEYLLTDFGNPYPYRLQFVAQYRFVQQIGEFLVRRDDYQELVAGLAKSWEISADRRTIVFHLRPGIYSAEEVVQSLRRLVSSGQTTHSNLAAQTELDWIQATGPLTVSIRTKGDAAAVHSPLVIADAVILPDDHWSKNPAGGEDQVDWKKARGPYRYSEGQFPPAPGSGATFTPNPDHYRYQQGQLAWRIEVVDSNKIRSMDDFEALFKNGTSYTTVRYWNRNPIFSRPSSVAFYETKPNGVSYILPNQNSEIFSHKSARVELLKRVLSADIELLKPELRAKQIAQPGLSGRLSIEDEKDLLSSISNSPGYKFPRELRWAIPAGAHENHPWLESVIASTGLQSKSTEKTVYPWHDDWKAGKFDATFFGVGMSDTDPISSSSFLFTPKGGDADLPNGEILNLLNGAKQTTDRALVSSIIRKAFRTALENGTIIPLHYIVNRHYHSRDVRLNINDPFTESVRIWEVRLD